MNIEKKVRRTIEKYKLLNKRERVVVALSGGKDSTTVLYLLWKFGYKVSALHIDLGLEKYSERCLEKIKEFCKEKKIKLHIFDIKKKFGNEKISDKKYLKNDFVYLDPPYLISASEYNKLWNKELESDLLKMIDVLDKKGVKFALSNVTHYNGSKNDLLLEWMKKYKVYKIESNYINYHNNGKKIIKEVLITNY